VIVLFLQRRTEEVPGAIKVARGAFADILSARCPPAGFDMQTASKNTWARSYFIRGSRMRFRPRDSNVRKSS
jgi:hypothetical protein